MDQIKGTASGESQGLQSRLMDQRSGPEDKMRVKVRVEGYGSG